MDKHIEGLPGNPEHFHPLRRLRDWLQSCRAVDVVEIPGAWPASSPDEPELLQRQRDAAEAFPEGPGTITDLTNQVSPWSQ